MRPYKPPKKAARSEHKIQDEIIQQLKGLNWYVRKAPSFLGSVGWPDLFACHRTYGSRWIEIKKPKGSKLSAAQREWFPKYRKYGWHVWFLTDKKEVDLLMRKPNWWKFDELLARNKADPAPYKKVDTYQSGPEGALQRELVRRFTRDGWLCRHIQANAIRSGFPDLHIAHPKYGCRFCEVKFTVHFTHRQVEEFREMYAKRCPIYFLTKPEDVDLVFNPPNWNVFFEKVLP